MANKPLVQNSADPKQIKAAKEKERFSRESELNDLVTVLNTVEGRRVLWRLMSHCGVFGSIFEQSSKIYYNSGCQDVGHFIMSEITEADQEFLFVMMRENQGEKT
ncbi:MAG: hypothetical protein A4E53_01660 [Pelotomaculum sp. PtaB.Bin104]|nr:MAG: hypothetical protein A4E53_01660 [Pelotomaculum sp. PtaB.Bin104]